MEQLRRWLESPSSEFTRRILLLLAGLCLLGIAVFVAV
jgi:hypothetical protein